jgi:chromate reductase, NAD(P)H dehydrogenase (quinone)
LHGGFCRAATKSARARQAARLTTQHDRSQRETFRLVSRGVRGTFAAMMTLIVGTNRPGSSTRKVAAEIEEIYRAMNVPLRVLDLAQLPPEVFLPSAYAEKPKSFAPFADAVLQASGLIVVTPEYNGSVPGVLKYFIDLLKFPESFEQRPVCFVGLAAGMWGALRPVEQLQMIFGYRNAFIFPERVFLPKVFELLDANGRIKDAELVERLRAQQMGFVEFVRKLK